jgi:hypothetical protein
VNSDPENGFAEIVLWIRFTASPASGAARREEDAGQHERGADDVVEREALAEEQEGERRRVERDQVEDQPARAVPRLRWTSA